MPATGDRITKRKDGLILYTAHTPDVQRGKHAYGRKCEEVERKLAERMGDTTKGFAYDDRVRLPRPSIQRCGDSQVNLTLS